MTEGLFSEAGVKYELGGIVTAAEMFENGDDVLQYNKQLEAYRGNGYDFVVELTEIDGSDVIAKENGVEVVYKSYKVGTELFDAFSYVVKK